MPGHAVAQERSLPRTVYRTFTLVDREFEPLGKVAGDGSHNSFAACPCCNVDVAVVGIPAKAMTPSFQFLVAQLLAQYSQPSFSIILIEFSIFLFSPEFA